jgi:hypothetical protein
MARPSKKLPIRTAGIAVKVRSKRYDEVLMIRILSRNTFTLLYQRTSLCQYGCYFFFNDLVTRHCGSKKKKQPNNAYFRLIKFKFNPYLRDAPLKVF